MLLFGMSYICLQIFQLIGISHTHFLSYNPDIAGKDYTSFVKVFGGKQLTTVNNMFNGKFVDTFNDTLTPVDWKSELFTTIDPVNEVKEKVLHNAGTIKISQ